MSNSKMNGMAKPDYLKKDERDQSFGEGLDGGGFARLAFKGSRFRLRQSGDETVLKETELDVVILKEYPAVSRIYYAGSYGAGGDNHPACASADGIRPLSSVPEPQHETCKGCPMDMVGSSTTDDGRKSRACGFYKRVVLLIKGYEDIGPVVCDLRGMTLFGDNQADANQWSYKAFVQRLKKHDMLPSQIWTTMSFDLNQAVPKVMFSPQGWVEEKPYLESVAPLIGTPDGQVQLEGMVSTETVRFDSDSDSGSSFQDRLAGTKPKHLESPANVEGHGTDDDDEAPKPAKKKKTAAKKAEAPAEEEPVPTSGDKDLEAVLDDFDF